MKVAYIAGPFSADTEEERAQNVRDSQAVALKYTKLGYCVIDPLSNFSHMYGQVSYEEIMANCLCLLHTLDSLFDVIVMRQRWEDSRGAVTEYLEAGEMGLEVIYEE